MSKQTSEGELAALALAVYVEELIAGRRVLFVGDAASPAAARLASAARSLDVVTRRSTGRGNRRGGRITNRPWPGEADPHRWDVVVVPDLVEETLASDEELAHVARWVEPTGVLVVGTLSSGEGSVRGLGYEAFFDLLSGAFEHVRTLGQTPFVGVSIVDFAPVSEVDVTFDGSVLEGVPEKPRRYFALCGSRDVALDAYTIVQLSSELALGSGWVGAANSDEVAARESQLRERQRELEGETRRRRDAEQALENSRERSEQASREVALARSQLASSERERARLEERARALQERLEEAAEGSELEDGYVALEEALRDRGRELAQVRAEVERRGVLVRDLVEQLRELQFGQLSESHPGATSSSVASQPSSAKAGPGLDAELYELHGKLENALLRAAEAEASRREAAERFDEARGQHALADARTARELEDMRRLEAALRGTVRGLNARLGEVIDLQQATQAELDRVSHEREAARRERQQLADELAARPDRSAEQGTDGTGARPPAAAAPVETEADEDRVRELVAELHRALEQAESALAQAGRDRARFDAAELRAVQLRGENAGLRLRLEDRERSVEALRTVVSWYSDESRLAGEQGAPSGSSSSFAPLDDRATELPPSSFAEVVSLSGLESAALRLVAIGASPSTQDERLDDPQEGGFGWADRAAEDAAARSALEDALRELEAKLAQSEGRLERAERAAEEASFARVAAERALEDCARQLVRAREDVETARAVASVQVEQLQRDLVAAHEQRDRSDAERERAISALHGVRVMLSEAFGPGLLERRASSVRVADHESLRNDASRADLDLHERDVLLRSLTAQLEERDDRIRALERVRDGSGPGEDVAVMQRSISELEERVARLRVELEAERAKRRL